MWTVKRITLSLQQVIIKEEERHGFIMIFKKKSEGALLYRIITGNKWDRNDKIRKVSFTTINVIVDSDKDYHWCTDGQRVVWK